MPDFKTIDRLSDIIAGVDERDPHEISELLYDLCDSIRREVKESAVKAMEKFNG